MNDVFCLFVLKIYIKPTFVAENALGQLHAVHTRRAGIENTRPVSLYWFGSCKNWSLVIETGTHS